MLVNRFIKRFYWKRRLLRTMVLSQSPVSLFIYFSILSFIIIIGIGWFLNRIEKVMLISTLKPDSIGFIAESLKLLGGAIFAGIAALLFTNAWQQKSLGFELLKELNSQELLEARNTLSNQKRVARRKEIDLEDITHWFPHNNSPKLEDNFVAVKFDKFKQKHALSLIIYYIIRLSNYSRNGMLDISVTKSLFHTFFAHHEVVILEFVEKFERYTKYEFSTEDYNNYPYNKKLWLKKVDDIRYFFKLIGLNGELPINHNYLYFSSLNNSEDVKVKDFASNYDFIDSNPDQDEIKKEINDIKSRIFQIEQFNSGRKGKLFKFFQ